MRLAVVVFPAGLAFAIGAGCSSFGDEAGADAGPSTDAAVESSAPDDGAPPDAGSVDSAVDGPRPDAGGRPCSVPGHLICDDFDVDTTLAKWKVVAPAANDVRVTSIDDAPSLPNGLGVTSADQAVARVSQSHAVSKSGVRCDFSVRLASRPLTLASVLLAQLTLTGTGYYRVELRAGDQNTPSYDGIGEYGDIPDAGSLPFSAVVTPLGNAWHRVRIEMKSRPTASLKVTLDGADVIATPKNDFTLLGAPTSMSLEFGASGFGPTAGAKWGAQFDDVRCDEIP